MNDYSLADARVLDVESRRAQANKILAVAAHFTRTHRVVLADDACALDLGCSSGVITCALTTRFANVVGVDVDRHALAQSESCACFAQASAMSLPFASEQFDFVLCNQIYQYVPDVARLFAEIRRVLRPDGFCYFSARNLLGLLARDNWLPLIASLAPRVADWLARPLHGERNWRQRAGTLWSYRRLRVLAARHFVVHDYSAHVLRTPSLASLFAPRGVHLPPLVAALVTPVLPTHIWILQKR